MRGQNLFIRPIESGDHEAVREFLKEHGGGEIPACGLLGKLAGELVAVAEFRLTAGAIQIDNVVVARDLRRKRIGRVMLDEVENLARKMDRSRLIVGEQPSNEDFFKHTGFEREGVRWIRYVRSQGAQRTSR